MSQAYASTNEAHEAGVPSEGTDRCLMRCD